MHTLFSGLGGPGNVVFPLLQSGFGENENCLVFYGTEPILEGYIEQSKQLCIETFSIIKKPKRYRAAAKKFKYILQQKQPDYVFVHSSELVVTAIRYRNSRKGCCVFYVEHENNASKGRILKILSKYAGKRADGIVCLSQNYAAQLKKQFSIKVPIHIIPNGVDINKFAPKQSAKTALIFGMASRMIPGKDHVTLFHAFKTVLKSNPSAQLQIAGSGETLDNLKRLVLKLGIEKSVFFLGLLDEKQIISFYANISIFVLATKSENLSTALLQAMSCGLEIITSNIENNRILIQSEKTGLLYENEDSEDLALKMLDAIKRIKEDNKMGQIARSVVIESYSNEQMSKKYTALLNKTIS